MPAQKRWVLLANFLENSFMKNEMAFYLSRQLDMEYTVRGQYVNLILNGNYVGLYWLGEQIRTDKNCVNIDDEKDFLIEMDQNYDEVWKCRTDLMDMPIQVKNDDKMTDERLTYIKGKFDALEAILCDPDFDKNTTFTDVLDVDSFAKYYLVNQIMFNGEISHPMDPQKNLSNKTTVSTWHERSGWLNEPHSCVFSVCANISTCPHAKLQFSVQPII